MQYTDDELKSYITKAYEIIPSLCEQLFYKHNDLKSIEHLYHYTNYNSFINGIVKDNREKDKEICLWATHCKHLNDPLEVILGQNRFNKIIKDENTKEKLSVIFKNDKLICFSKKKDFLPMWSMYGNNGSGIMLSLNTKKLLREYGYRLMPCIYKNSDYDLNAIQKLFELSTKELATRLNKGEKSFVILILSIIHILLLKDNSYKYEDEVRIIGIGNKLFEKPSKEEYRVINGNKVVSYTKEYLKKDILEEVIIGPNQEVEKNCETIKNYLNSIGFGHVNVEISKVPYKG